MQDQHLPANPSRRRLAKAGAAAAPVVLASLASKSAFAAAPYQLTISGQMSGNPSPFGPNPNPTAPVTVGDSSATVQSSLTNVNTTFASVFTLANLYFQDANQNSSASKLAGSKLPSYKEASLYNVVRLTAYSTESPPPDPHFAKMAVVLYQNAKNFGGERYPLKPAEVVAMFNDTINGRDYNGSTSLGAFKWSPAQVKTYFSKLYF